MYVFVTMDIPDLDLCGTRIFPAAMWEQHLTDVAQLEFPEDVLVTFLNDDYDYIEFADYEEYANCFSTRELTEEQAETLLTFYPDGSGLFVMLDTED